IFPMLSAIEINSRVFGFTTLLSIFTGIAFGLAPALHVSKPDLNESLKDGGRNSGAGSSQNRLRGALVIAEVAMSVVLWIGAGRLIKSVMRLRNVNPGFNGENRLAMSSYLPSAKYPKAPSWIAFYNQVEGRVESLPGVKSAGLVSV